MTTETRFRHFSQQARQALSRAVEESRRYWHNSVGTEHILLGLVGDSESVAVQILSILGVDARRVRSAVELIVARGDKQPSQGEICLTNPARKAVQERAVDEARQMNDVYIDTEHLLIGLLREDKGLAAVMLESMGVTLDKVRVALRQILEAGKNSGLEDLLVELRTKQE